LKLHHIGIVVPKIEDSLGELTKFFQFETISVPSLIGTQKVNVCFLKIGEPFLELIEPAEEDSPVSTFVRNGGGFHHLCFEVKDLHKKIGEMVQNGARVVVEPVIGFENRLISFVFLNMKTTKCNLIEFVEEKKRN